MSSVKVFSKENDTADVPLLALRAAVRIRSLFLKGDMGWNIKAPTTKINLCSNSATHTITISVRSALKLTKRFL